MSLMPLMALGSDEEERYEIVGSQESDPRIGCISEDSPIGRALMGHKEDDEVTVEAPDGVLRFRIVSVSR